MNKIRGQERKILKKQQSLQKSAYRNLDWTIDVDRMMGLQISDEEVETIRERLKKNIDDLEKRLTAQE